MPINETAQQFVSLCLRENINGMSLDNAPETVDQLLADRYPDVAPGVACEELIVNSVKAGIEKARNTEAERTQKWIRVGQMDLFDSGEFFIPASFLPKSIADTYTFLLGRLAIEEADEAAKAKALDDQKEQTAKVRKSMNEARRLYVGVEASGQDPTEVSVEQAIKQAAAVQGWDAADVGASAKRPLRPLRTPADGADADRPFDSDQ